MKQHTIARGFTLVELLVVIASISILSSIILASFHCARSKATDVARKADVKSIKTAMELYYSEHNRYPWQGDCAGGPENSGLDLGSVATQCLVPTYLSSDPTLLTQDGDMYTWSPPYGYGLWVYTESAPQDPPYYGYCKTGVKMNPGWWDISAPICNF